MELGKVDDFPESLTYAEPGADKGQIRLWRDTGKGRTALNSAGHFPPLPPPDPKDQ